MRLTPIQTFRSPQASLLASDGALAPLAEAAPRLPLSRPLVVVSRAACRFQRLDGIAPGRFGRAARAARLAAEAGAPFARPGVRLVSDDRGYAAWVWDQAAVDAATRPLHGERPVDVAPEAALHPAMDGDGWRQLKVFEGYEAQAWRGGRLAASYFRPTRFDAAAWREFTRATGGADAPATPPPPFEPAPPWRTRALPGAVIEPPDAETVGLWAAGVVAAAALATSAHGAVRLWRAEADLAREEAALARLAPVVARAEAARRELARSSELGRAYADLTGGLNPIRLMAEVAAAPEIEITTVVGLNLQDDRLQLTMELPPPDMSYQIRPAVEVLERRTDLAGVEAEPDRAKNTVTYRASIVRPGGSATPSPSPSSAPEARP